MGLIQDTLILPNSVTYVGDYVLSRSGDYHTGETTMIGTLVIGENVAHIGKAAFGFNTYKKAVVRTVQADVPPRSDVDMELPICTEIEIHRGSPYYDYFAKSTQEGHITLLCEDFETTRGEEYYDAQKKAFVTPVTDACTVCGYRETSEEYSEACTVIFKDYDGRELSRQHLHKGEDATAPKEPERTGWQFTGWDKEFTGVTSDLTIKAVYQIREYAVVFKDYDGTDGGDGGCRVHGFLYVRGTAVPAFFRGSHREYHQDGHETLRDKDCGSCAQKSHAGIGRGIYLHLCRLAARALGNGHPHERYGVSGGLYIQCSKVQGGVPELRRERAEGDFRGCRGNAGGQGACRIQSGGESHNLHFRGVAACA